MGRFGILAALLVCANSPASVNAGSWQPAGPFKMSPAVDRCVAARSFTRGGQNLVVSLEARPTTNDYAFKVLGPGSLDHQSWEEGTYMLGSLKPARNTAVAERSTRKGILIYSGRTNRVELAAAGPDPDLKYHMRANPLEVRVAGLGASLSALESCSADLLERWGYSKDFQHGLAKFPELEKELSSYASASDYPVAALVARATGVAHVLVDVGIDGRSSNCRVIRSSGRQDIDNQTCIIVTKRARYHPALSVKGEPVGAPRYLTMRWDLPRR